MKHLKLILLNLSLIALFNNTALAEQEVIDQRTGKYLGTATDDGYFINYMGKLEGYFIDDNFYNLDFKYKGLLENNTLIDNNYSDD